MSDEVNEDAHETRRGTRARAEKAQARRRRPRMWLAIGLVLVLLAVAGTVVWFSFPLRAQSAAEEAVADIDEIRFDSDVWKDSAQAHDLFERVVTGLGEPLRTNGTVELADVEVDGGQAVATLRWTWTDERAEGTSEQHDSGTAAAEESTWTYESELSLRRNGLFWWADLNESAIHPELGRGGVLEAHANPGRRGAILGADGEPLMTEGEVVEVGVHPGRLEPDTLQALVKSLNSHEESLDLDETALEKKVDAVDTDELVPVVTLRRDDYETVKDDIHSLPGVVFTERTQTLSRKRGFAQATLGTAGPATAEEIEKSAGTLTEGSVVGKSGLQKALDDRLAAPSTAEIFAKDAESGELVSLHSFPQQDGQDVETTLDVRIQEAADAAAATATKPAALVAIRPSDGHVVAVANHDPGGAGWDRALTGQYPPGSVFKVASGLALLESGVTPQTRLDCPMTTTVEGKSFKNAEDHALGRATFDEDFAESCNTAFVEAASTVSGDDVSNAARNLGMADFDLGIGAAAAELPSSDDPVVHAAQMIGQGEVLASPVSVAAMAASVADGNTVSPVLVLPDAGTDIDEQVIDETAIAQMQTLMRSAVTDGTASALEGIPGEPVHGKTGTAEYGSESPPRTHSWFAGYQGDLAIAVLVEDGGFGADAAVPVAKEFFTALG